MAGFFAGIVSWLLSRATRKFIGDVITKLAGTDDGQIKLAEIEASTRVALKAEDTAQLAEILKSKTSLQQAKMNWPVFWVLIVAMMGPPILMLWSVWAYNIFWWDRGIWPQPWAIADFPPSIKPWAQAAVDWLYDPWGPPSGVGAAILAGRFTGRK